MTINMLRLNIALCLMSIIMFSCANTERAKIKAVDVANTKISDYYPSQPTDKNKKVFVFVHGIFGDAFKTWQNDNGTYFFDLIKQDTSGVFTGSDIFVFGFPSDFSGVSYTPDEAARSLATAMRISRVIDYQQIIFVAHSMGGLITLRYLFLNPDVAAKVPLAFFYSTPQTGSDIAKLASIFSNNPGLDSMFPNKNGHEINLYLGSLDEDWKTAIYRKQISTVIRCAYEKKPIYGQLIVDEESATRFCQGSAYPIPKDHIDMVKPADVNADSYRALYDAVSLYYPPKHDAVVYIEGVGSTANVNSSVAAFVTHVDIPSINLNISANKPYVTGSQPTTIKDVSILFHTIDGEKSNDTWLTTQIICNDKSIAGRSEPYGKFSKGTNNGFYLLHLIDSTVIGRFKDKCILSIHIDSKSHDNWRFNSNLDITFSDESHRIFEFQNTQLDGINWNKEFPLQLND